MLVRALAADGRVVSPRLVRGQRPHGRRAEHRAGPGAARAVAGVVHVDNEVVGQVVRHPENGAVVWSADELVHLAPFLTAAQADSALAAVRRNRVPRLRALALTHLVPAAGPERHGVVAEVVDILARMTEPDERRDVVDALFRVRWPFGVVTQT